MRYCFWYIYFVNWLHPWPIDRAAGCWHKPMQKSVGSILTSLHLFHKKSVLNCCVVCSHCPTCHTHTHRPFSFSALFLKGCGWQCKANLTSAIFCIEVIFEKFCCLCCFALSSANSLQLVIPTPTHTSKQAAKHTHFRV